MRIVSVLSALMILGLLCSCNKDNTIPGQDNMPPEISLDSEDGIYTVKVGHELTINPTVRHGGDAAYKWTLDGQIVCREASFTKRWDEEGVFYPVLTVTTKYGKAEEELKIEVQALTPPVISLKIPSRGLKVVAGNDYILSPNIQHDDIGNFRIEWFVDGVSAGKEKKYTFHQDIPGTYKMKIVASNTDGTTEKQFDIEVVETMPCSIEFPTPYYTATSTDRYTFAGRPVYLAPHLEYFDDPQFSWSVDGEAVDCKSRTYVFTPSLPGKYIIRVTVNEGAPVSQNVSENIIRSGISATQEVKVVCVDAAELERMRPKNGASSPYLNKVYEWIPAPGQFIGETGIGGMTGSENSYETANAWAQSQLASKRLVSLGGFGGYIIVGFDHSIALSGDEYDFAVMGNAFNESNGGSNEPGIVWVMQDVNGNGLPDDEWYELRGSETGNSETIQNYSVTYFKPSGAGQHVEWEDSEGQTGQIEYLGEFHSQGSYYPAWISAESYTLWGTRLPSRNQLDPATGFWNNRAYGWGYADNAGSDNLKGPGSPDGTGQRTGFKISNAMYPDGTPVKLEYVDFIKVQTGVNAKSGHLGEISTEVFDFQDLSMTK